MTLREIIKNFDGRLTNADQRLVQALLANPNEGVFLSVQEVASRASVHPTSAVRLAQKLGFSGYAELRVRLREEVISRSEPAGRMQQRLERLEHGSLKVFVDSEIAALAELPTQISQHNIEAAAKILIGAERIFLFGYGHAEVLVHLMDMRLSRSGYATRIVREPARHLATELSNMTAKDALLLFEFGSVGAQVLAMLHHIKRIGARTVAISDTTGLMLRPTPNVLLAASRGQEGEAQSLTVPMAICNNLVLIVSQLDGGRSIENLAAIGAMRKKLEI